MSKKLLSFLCIGLVILLLDSWLDSSNRDKTIILYDDEINSLIDTWTAQVGRPPNEEDLKGIINQLVEEEILYREALKLGLDKDDIIIKRRLAQKIGFLKQEEQSNVPTETQLRNYYEDKQDNYFLDNRYSFTHLYFSKENNGKARADNALIQLIKNETTPRSEPFLVGKNFLNKTAKEIDRDFGKGFARNLINLREGVWMGPFDSIYGSHLVKTSNFKEARMPEYVDVKKEVLLDFLLEKKQGQMRDYINSLKDKYEIKINPEFNYR